ncbi:GNAT family N-acetyltransferase [Sphaerisporangium sp. B11E5]|uniref:GNAT family N-acetyltransferase n=1 Tax=Sphaerisporangium sp. B11E5 TaxID=3153563 RepID=UPI00325DE661
MEGLSIRDMTMRDVRQVSTVRITGWKAAYVGMVPQEYLDGLSVEADMEQRRKLFGRDARVHDVVAEHGGAVVGWAVLGPCRDEWGTGRDGEIYALYVAPELIGRGVGRGLVRELVSRARRANQEFLHVWVIEENHRARRFYERAGFTPDGERELWDVGGASVPELRYVRALSEAGQRARRD